MCETEREETAIATIIVRGATENIMDDIERAIDDGVNTFKALTKVAKLTYSEIWLITLDVFDNYTFI